MRITDGTSTADQENTTVYPQKPYYNVSATDTVKVPSTDLIEAFRQVIGGTESAQEVKPAIEKPFGNSTMYNGG